MQIRWRVFDAAQREGLDRAVGAGQPYVILYTNNSHLVNGRSWTEAARQPAMEG
jgi:hypothetical protein